MFYFGPDFTETEIRAALDAQQLKYQRFENIEEEIAKVLAEKCDRWSFRGQDGIWPARPRQSFYPLSGT